MYMQQTTLADANTQSAYDLVTGSDADVLPGPEAVLELLYACPGCGQTDGMRAEVMGARAICWCPDCRENTEDDDDLETYGVHDLLGQYVLEGDYDFSLRDVPADRATVCEDVGAN